MGMFDRMVGNMSDRMTEFDEATQLYRQGERNIGEQALMGASTAVGGLLDVPGEVFSTLTPDVVKEGMAHVAQGVMDTPPAQMYMQWRKENPRAAENVERAGGLAVEFAGGAYAQRAPKAGVDNLARNMPNELKGFYGSGRAGQGLSLLRAGPAAAVDVTKEAFSPAAQAATRGGVNPAIKRASQRNLKEGGDPSFIEGQMDQTTLLNRGAGRQQPVLDEIFADVQVLDSGALAPETFRKAFTSYKPEQYAGMKVDNELIDNMYQRVKDVHGLPSDAQVVIRHPTALTDLYPESNYRGGAPAKNMYKARDMMAKHFPDKKGFNSQLELAEFVATKNLVDHRMVRKDGKPMTKLDKKRVEMFGPGNTYKEAESGLGNVEQYYKYKKMDELHRQGKGKKLDKRQQAKYDMYKGRIERGMKDIEFDSQGRAYFSGSHRSTAKGLGGVNDQYVVDRDGNVMHYINDENDLFGVSVPGDKRVVSITPPAVYNIWEKTGAAPLDKTGKALRDSKKELLGEKYNAPYVGGRGAEARRGFQRQMGQAAVNYNPRPELQDFKIPAANVAATGGLLSTLTDEENNE